MADDITNGDSSTAPETSAPAEESPASQAPSDAPVEEEKPKKQKKTKDSDSPIVLPMNPSGRDKRIHARQKVDRILKNRPVSAKVKVRGNIYRISNVRNDGDILCCTVVGPGLTDNDFRFVNPPIMVPDGSTSTKYDASGKAVKIQNFKEDPRAALLQIVKDAVETVL